MLTVNQDGKVEFCCWGLIEFIRICNDNINFTGVLYKHPKLYMAGVPINFCPVCGNKLKGDINDDADIAAHC